MGKATSGTVISHWSHLFEDFQTSPKGFYDRVELEIERREIPDAALSRVEWAEGGALSARREYLRVTRRRLVFDVCAAPFGKGFFFSWWLTDTPPSLRCLYGMLFGIVLVVFAQLQAGWVGTLQGSLAEVLWMLIPLSLLVLYERGHDEAKTTVGVTLEQVIAAIGLGSFLVLSLLGSGLRFANPLWVAQLLSFLLLSWRMWHLRGPTWITQTEPRMVATLGLTAFVADSLLPFDYAFLYRLAHLAGVFGIVLFILCLRGWMTQPDKPSLSRALAGLPFVGPLLVRTFEPETYYRTDTMLTFQAAVSNAVQEAIETLTDERGMRALSEQERKPVMRDFFER